MATSTSIRLDDELSKWIKEFADFNGTTKTKVISDILREKMEDDKDYLDGIQSIEDSKDEPLISKEEMMKRYL
ncbi:hypothetical protein JZO70_07995 [Enterococcus sp. 669A]|uniref:CopG family transcriptional regulator n=1 Tax=Candidatus Enterococcus moelleringii TaxID=2815325 RepID=A0ABS3L8Z3_9ENTE|nr:DUF6290 family protein [Enterococcus sp. 669A]MBO1306099.1 hypothetical protein [Enterococcus sp. 669A]